MRQASRGSGKWRRAADRREPRGIERRHNAQGELVSVA